MRSSSRWDDEYESYREDHDPMRITVDPLSDDMWYEEERNRA